MGSWENKHNFCTMNLSNINLSDLYCVTVEYMPLDQRHVDYKNMKKYFDWLDENYIDEFKWDFVWLPGVLATDSPNEIMFGFENEDDKILFVLRWA